MERNRQVIVVIFLVTVCALLSVGDTRSLGSLKHKIMKRSLYEETCPPPYIIEVTEECNDTCLSDDYCVGNKMCCFDGCSYVCMEPVPSEPVVDWIDDKSFLERTGDEELEVVTPIVEELGCYYHGMMLNDGERIPLGCKLCSCFNGNLMCDVSNCNKEYQARLAHSGSGSGDDDNDDDDDDDVKGEGSGNSFRLIDGVKQKEDFIPFEEFENNGNSGVELKEEFIPFKQDNRDEELSGEEDKHNELNREHFIPFDEETNSEQSGEDAASYARRRL